MRTTPRSREQLRRSRAWTIGNELAAQQVELLSVIAAEMRIRKPREVPRPDWLTRGSNGVGGREGMAKAIETLRRANRRVHVVT